MECDILWFTAPNVLLVRKSIFVGQYIPWQSFCQILQKVNLVSCLVFRAYKICSEILTGVENIRNIFGSLGYPSDVINKTINNIISKFNRAVEQVPKKCPVYLRLPSIFII